MSRFLFTAGTSALGAAHQRDERAKLLGLPSEVLTSGQQPAGRGERDRATSAERAALTDEAVERISAVLDHHTNVESFGLACRKEAQAAARPADADSALRKLGAEGESIARRCLAGGEVMVPQLTDDAELYLLASDTVGCVLAATISVLLSGRSPRFLVVDEDGAYNLDLGGSGLTTAEILVVRGMSASSAQGIEGAALALTKAMSLAASDPHDRSLIVEFSGGYKASIPLLIHLLEYIASIQADQYHAQISLWFRHEDRPAEWLRARLRRLDHPELNAHARDLSRVAQGSTPGNSILAGFGWDEDEDGTYQLTTIGRSAAALLRSHGYPIRR